MADEARSQQASLGCGTLILIALIVLIFSGRGVDDVEREVRGLRTDIDELTKSVEIQTGQIKLLEEKVDKLPAAGAL